MSALLELPNWLYDTMKKMFGSGESTPYAGFNYIIKDINEERLERIGREAGVEHLSKCTFPEPAFPAHGILPNNRCMVPLAFQQFGKPDSPIINVWCMVVTGSQFTCLSVKTLEAFVGVGNVVDGQTYSFAIQDPTSRIECQISKKGFEHVNMIGTDTLCMLKLSMNMDFHRGTFSLTRADCGPQGMGLVFTSPYYADFNYTIEDINEERLEKIGRDAGVEHLSKGTFHEPAFPVRGTVPNDRCMVSLAFQQFGKPDSPIINVWCMIVTGSRFTCLSVKTLEAFLGAGNVVDGQTYSFAIQILSLRRISNYLYRSMTTKRFGPEDIGINKLAENQKEDVKNVKNSEWKKVLPDEVYRVARESGTERPGTGGFDNYFEKGRYVCLCCGSELFNSDSKFWAGCGWPAFSESVGKDMNITRIVDRSHGMVRTEVRCKTCDAHLGHVFNDGPKETTGERYCINSVCMAFEKAPQ